MDSLGNSSAASGQLVYLGLGSNMGDRAAALRSAIDLLATPELRLLRTSSLYETEPVGFRDQPWFLNIVAEFECDLQAPALLALTQGVEREMGRQRTIPNGPRVIDIDILLFGDAVIQQTDLVIPHPRYAERLFVLEPLAELAPDLLEPVSRRTVGALLTEARCGADRVLRYS